MYGIPFPVFARASFGLRGANIPAHSCAPSSLAAGSGFKPGSAVSRSIQMVKIWIPWVATLPPIFPAVLGLETGPAISFFLFWA